MSFQDPLVPQTGVGTILITLCEPSDDEAGIRWSLTLSHLQYYGKPVQVQSDRSDSRISIDDLFLITLGAVFKLWRLEPSKFGDATKWFDLVGSKLEGSVPGRLQPLVVASRRLLSPKAEMAEEIWDLSSMDTNDAENFS